MDQIQEKIELFEDHLIKHAKKAHENLINSAEKNKKKRILEAELALQDEKRNLEERNYQMIFRDKNRMMAGSNNQAKNERLTMNHQIQVDFTQTLLDHSRKMSMSETYKNYFERSVASLPELCGNKKDLVFSVSDRDRPFLESMIAACLPEYNTNIEILEDSDLLSGGFTVRDREEHFFCDFTIAHLLREEKQKIGKFLYEKMLPYIEGDNHDE